MTSRIIAVGNLKGGTGKSTVAVNLACCLAERQAVALVDADPQGTAAAWLRHGAAKVVLHASRIPLSAKRIRESKVISETIKRFVGQSIQRA